MTTPDDLFDASAIGSPTRAPTRWRAVTNRQNLFYMLATGLVMGPAGFGNKYYKDALSLFPGWIPLFRTSVPRPLIELAVSERAHLRACLIELDLESLQGPCMAMDSAGVPREVQYPTDLSGDETAILVPAPLPTAWIAHIGFESKDDKAQALADAKDFGNVPLGNMRMRTEKRAFTHAPNIPWPPADMALPSRDRAPAIATAIGGVTTMLLHLANRGEVATRASRLAFDPDAVNAAPFGDAMVQPLPEWLHSGRPPSTEDISAGLFWGAVGKIALSRFQDPRPEPAGLVLDYLTASAADMDERMRLPLERLATDLRGIIGLGDSTVTELFERHSKPFSIAMILFFLREKCADLLDFSHPRLREEHLVLAAILFGARCGWLDLPLRLRDIPRLSTAISHRMATIEHAVAGSGLDLGPPPPSPRSLRELLAASEKGWSSRQKEAALLLARAGGWSCVQTRVTLGKGEYRMRIDGRGTEFTFAGEAKAVVTEVDPDSFFAHLTNGQPSPQAESKARALLDG